MAGLLQDFFLTYYPNQERTVRWPRSTNTSLLTLKCWAAPLNHPNGWNAPLEAALLPGQWFIPVLLSHIYPNQERMVRWPRSTNTSLLTPKHWAAPLNHSNGWNAPIKAALLPCQCCTPGLLSHISPNPGENGTVAQKYKHISAHHEKVG